MIGTHGRKCVANVHFVSPVWRGESWELRNQTGLLRHDRQPSPGVVLKVAKSLPDNGLGAKEPESHRETVCAPIGWLGVGGELPKSVIGYCSETLTYRQVVRIDFIW